VLTEGVSTTGIPAQIILAFVLNTGAAITLIVIAVDALHPDKGVKV